MIAWAVACVMLQRQSKKLSDNVQRQKKENVLPSCKSERNETRRGGYAASAAVEQIGGATKG